MESSLGIGEPGVGWVDDAPAAMPCLILSTMIDCMLAGTTYSVPVPGRRPVAVGVKVASGIALALSQGCSQIPTVVGRSDSEPLRPALLTGNRELCGESCCPAPPGDRSSEYHLLEWLGSPRNSDS